MTSRPYRQLVISANDRSGIDLNKVIAVIDQFAEQESKSTGQKVTRSRMALKLLAYAINPDRHDIKVED